MLTTLKSWLMPAPSTRSRSTRHLSLTTLEAREVPAADIFLDFNGISSAELEDLKDAIPVNPDLANSNGALSFLGEFTTLQTQYGGYDQYSWLDFDGNGKLTTADGEIAVGRIISRVREDFAPYDVFVTREDQAADYIEYMTNSETNDAVVIVTGHATNDGGQSLIDADNRTDNGMWAESSVGTARRIVSKGEWTGTAARDAFLNSIANFISHEVGHSFGLQHVNTTVHSDVRSLMLSFPKDRNYGFTDQPFTVGGGTTQNAHEYLTDTVGESTQAWAAVLTPSNLTIRGGSGADTVRVTVESNGFWLVEASGRQFAVDPDANPTLNSLNQFAGTAIDSVRIYGGMGNDNLTSLTSAVPNVVTYLWGEDGDDVLIGSDGRDRLYGGIGHDILVGLGGDDRLYGESGKDILIGGHGADELYGGTNDDVLVAGHSTIVNYSNYLTRLRTEWTANYSYNNNRDEVNFLLNTFTYSDVATDIILAGEGGLDIFFHGLTDPLDATPSEWRRVR